MNTYFDAIVIQLTGNSNQFSLFTTSPELLRSKCGVENSILLRPQKPNNLLALVALQQLQLPFAISLFQITQAGMDAFRYCGVIVKRIVNLNAESRYKPQIES